MLVTVYYADGLKNGDTFVPVQVRVPATVSTIKTAAEQVVQAPENLKLYSSVPVGTKVQSANFTAATGVATVDLSAEAANVQGTAAAQTMMASFVYTLTEVPNVKAVQLWINGHPAVLHGIEWSKPLSRQDLQAQYPHQVEPMVKFVP
jgi:spore germination protein GerM